MAQTILVIDDEYFVLAMLEDILGARGYKVLTANRASAGMYEAIYSHPSLIFLDIILPDKDGLTLLAELTAHERTRRIPVVLMSSLSRAASLNSAGAAAYLQKPLNPDEVVSLVGRLLAPSP
jgi:DNA-binding response OmpR family regulator